MGTGEFRIGFTSQNLVRRNMKNERESRRGAMNTWVILGLIVGIVLLAVAFLFAPLYFIALLLVVAGILVALFYRGAHGLAVGLILVILGFILAVLAFFFGTGLAI